MTFYSIVTLASEACMRKLQSSVLLCWPLFAVLYKYNAAEMVNIQQDLGRCDKTQSGGQVQIGHVVQTNEEENKLQNSWCVW